MNILVTGGAGRIGHYVVGALLEAGHAVVSLDKAPPVRPIPGARYVTGSTSSVEDVHGAIAAARGDAVIHLAAWSNYGVVADTRTHNDNVAGTFNVLHVSAAQHVRRVILASSAQVYGFEHLAPIYVPVDEGHPLRPLNAYAQSKAVGESIADYFVRTTGMSVLSFRIMGARPPEDLPAEIATLTQAPERGQFLLWTRCDARDVATACRRAIETEAVASGAYNISGSRVVLDHDSMDLVRRYCPATEFRAPLPGRISPLGCDKARRAFGYEPVFF